MTRYRMENSTVVDTENAVAWWGEETDFDGNNHVSRATRSEGEHQTLYKSRKGRYYVEHENQWQGSSEPHAEWVSPQEATRWLLLMEYEIPEDLEDCVDQVSE